MIEKTAKYLSQCPFLDGTAVKVNYLNEKPFAVSLRMKSASPVVKRYADGGQMCECRFTLELRQVYCGADNENIAAAQRCRDIEGWLDSQNNAGIFPEFRNGEQPLSLTVEKSFEIVHIGNVDARFEAELSLVYYKE